MKQLSPNFMDDLRRLRVLREFRERQTITATAEALHLTPSAVSQQLAGLTRDLGFAVTEREGRHLVLTPRGQALLEHADRVFAQIEQARHVLHAFDEEVRGTVRIGAFSTAIVGLLPRVLDDARGQAPGLSIHLRQVEPPAVFDELDSGRLDVALALSFTGSPGSADPRYHHVALGPDPLDVALPTGHPKASQDRVDLRELQNDTWITGRPDGCCAVVAVAACAAAGFAPHVAHHVDDWHALSQLVAGGHGVSLMPRMAQHNLPRDLVVRPVAGQQPQRHLFAAVREGGQDSPLLTIVLDLLRQAVAAMPQLPPPSR
jgi:DNA-binding transcriptional LysR family regulator